LREYGREENQSLWVECSNRKSLSKNLKITWFYFFNLDHVISMFLAMAIGINT